MPPADSKVRPGCGVELGSDNAALVIQNSYWIWIEQSSFIIGPARGQKAPTCLNPLDSLTCCQVAIAETVILLASSLHF